MPNIIRSIIYTTLLLIVTAASVNVAAQEKQKDSAGLGSQESLDAIRAMNTVYVLDGNIITKEEYHATSLSKISSMKCITSKDDPLFRKYAKENTFSVCIISSADSFEESVLNFRYDASKFPPTLHDGVGFMTDQVFVPYGPNEPGTAEVVRDSAFIGLFEPFTGGGVINIITKQKNFLNKIARNRKTDCLKLMAEKSDKLSKEDKEYISDALLSDASDTSKWIVVIVDGIEYAESWDPEIGLDDIESMKLVTDPAICNNFAPRRGGVLKITTKSKPLLNIYLQKHAEVVREAMERSHKAGRGWLFHGCGLVID